MFIVSNIEPFDTEKDAEAAAKKLGKGYEVYCTSDGDEDEEDDEDENEYDEDDLDDDEEED